MPRQAKQARVNRESFSWLSCHFYKWHSLAHQPFGFRYISASGSVFETVAPPTVARPCRVSSPRASFWRGLILGKLTKLGTLIASIFVVDAPLGPRQMVVPLPVNAPRHAVWRAKRLSLCSNRPGGGGKEATSLPLRFRSLGQ